MVEKNMYLTKELAFDIETCIKQTHIDLAHCFSFGKVLEIGGGAACFAGSSSFFSQVIGWGFKLKTKEFKTHIELIEQFYRGCGHFTVDIELCPLVGNDVFIALSERGYSVTELNNISFFNLSSHSIQEGESLLTIRKINPDEIEQWAKIVALGFGCLEAQEQFACYARLNAVDAFAAYDNQQMVAGATIAKHGKVADLGVTSTIPTYRNRGLQKLLLKKRLDFAKNIGLSLLTVTTEPGSISNLNIQKIGFDCAYTRIKLSRKLLS